MTRSRTTLRWAICALAGVMLASCAAQTSFQPRVPAPSRDLSLDARSGVSGAYLAARHAARARDNEIAATFFERALAERPDDEAILEEAFLADLGSGRTETAVRRARQIVRLRSDDILARLVLAVDAMRAGSYRQVRDHFAAAGGGPFVSMMQELFEAWADAGEGRSAAASARLEKATGDGAGLDIYRAYHAALISDWAGDVARAERLYRIAVDASNGSVLRTIQAYGSFLERNGRRSEARDLYRSFMETASPHPVISAGFYRAQRGGAPPPRLVNTPSEGAAEATYTLGQVFSFDRKGILDLPIIYFYLSLHLRPDFPQAQAMLADTLALSGQMKAASRVFAEIPRKSPLWAHARIRIAQGLNQQGRSREAIASLKDVIAMAPDNLDVMASIAGLYQSNQDFAAAAEYYARAIESVGSDPDPTHWALFFEYGVALERSKRWTEAETQLQRALDLRPNQPEVLNYLGYSWIDRGIRLSEAMDIIRTAVSLAPENGFIVDSLGWGLYRIGDHAGAVETLERAVALQPGDPIINEHLGDAYWQVGRRIEARFQWNHALAMGARPDAVDRVQDKLLNGLTAETEAVESDPLPVEEVDAQDGDDPAVAVEMPR